MICERCGSQVDSGLKTCPVCGADMNVSVNAADPEAQARFVSYMQENQPVPAQANYAPAQQPKKKKGPMIALGAAAVLIVAVVAGIFAYPSILRSISPAGYIEYAQSKTEKTVSKEFSDITKAMGNFPAEKVFADSMKAEITADFKDLVTGDAEIDQILQGLKLEVVSAQDNKAKKVYSNAKAEVMGISADASLFVDEDNIIAELPEALGLGKIKLTDSEIADKWNNSELAELFGTIDGEVDFADFFKTAEDVSDKDNALVKKFSETFEDLIKNHSKTENMGKQSVKALGGDYYDTVITADAEAWNDGIKEILKEIYSEENINEMFSFMPMPLEGVDEAAAQLQAMIDEINVDGLKIHVYTDSKNRAVGWLVENEVDDNAASVGLYLRGEENLIDNIVLKIGVNDEEPFRFELNSKHNADGKFSTEMLVTIDEGFGKETVSLKIDWASEKEQDNLTLTIDPGIDSEYIKLTGSYYEDTAAGVISFSSTGIEGNFGDGEFNYRWNVSVALSAATDADIKEISTDGAKDFFDEEVIGTLGDAVQQFAMGMGGMSYDDYGDYDYEDLENLEDYEDIDWENFDWENFDPEGFDSL